MTRWGRIAALSWALGLGVLPLVLPSCGQGDQRAKILVFAAASLTDVLTDVGEAFESQSGIEVAFSFGASQALAQQISAGAPADVFISAGAFPVDFLDEAGRLSAKRFSVVRNTLVVVARPEVATTLTALDSLTSSAIRRLAIADPELTPAGRYTREALSGLGLWEELVAKSVFGADVRATLSYVESHNADAGLVYLSDAATAPGLAVLDLVPPDSYSPIEYPAVLVASSDRHDSAKAFLEFLSSASAKQMFVDHGFGPPD